MKITIKKKWTVTILVMLVATIFNIANIKIQPEYTKIITFCLAFVCAGFIVEKIWNPK